MNAIRKNNQKKRQLDKKNLRLYFKKQSTDSKNACFEDVTNSKYKVLFYILRTLFYSRMDYNDTFFEG